jgi:alanine racemase
MAASIEGLAPVVKGNGYGFGRATLHPIAHRLSDHVCVGTIHELDGVPDTVTPIVLTPTLVAPSSNAMVLTVGSGDDVAALTRWRGRVIVKLQSSMRRYGATPADFDQVVLDAGAAGLDVVGYALHLPLAGSDTDRLDEIGSWLGRLDRGRPLWLSHLQPQAYTALQGSHPDRSFRLRVGTSLWHGDKTFLHLSANVIAVHRVRAGERAGYRLTHVPDDGHLLLVDAGAAHGVAALPDGASPFHFARTRLAMLEPPHMHTTMLLAATGTPCPSVGDRVDLQRPLISTSVDEIEWV